MTSHPAGLPVDLRDAIRAGAGVDDLRVREAIRRPGSMVWRVEGTRGDGRPRRLIVKVGTHQRAEDASEAALGERARREFEALAWMHAALPADGGIAVPEPVLVVRERAALVIEECAGETLQALVLRAARGAGDGARLERAFGKAGHALTLIQERAAPQDEPLDLERLLAYDELRLARLEAARSIAPALAAAVRAESRRLAGLVGHDERRSVVTHGDFCPGNILLDGESIVLLDFAMLGRGSIYHDLSYCHEHLERFLVRYRARPSRELIRRLQAALLAGYSPSAAVERPLFRLGQIRHHLNFLVNTHERAAGLRRIARRIDRARGLRSLRAWLCGRGVSPVAARA